MILTLAKLWDPDLGDGAAIRWHPDGEHFLVTARGRCRDHVRLRIPRPELLRQAELPWSNARDATFSPCGEMVSGR